MKNHIRFEDKVDDLGLLLSFFPKEVTNYLKETYDLSLLFEVVLDVGYVPEARFYDSVERFSVLGEVTQKDIDEVVSKIGAFNGDNRAGIERTLHRISAVRNRTGRVIGLTCRVGRAIEGTIEIIRDVIESGKNILFLGPPGVGKTTKLRETARVLSGGNKRVIVVDTSNEIAGDGDIPHPGIGLARRMQVPSPDRQHSVMIEAVENHMPEVIIVDEIGTEEETAAARTIAERGVQLVATAHGRTLENLLKNPVLSDLIGGVQNVVLGDEEAKFRGTQKTVLERKAMPTFDVIIEIKERDTVAIYLDVSTSVDSYLRGYPVQPETRTQDVFGHTSVTPGLFQSSSELEELTPLPAEALEPMVVFPFALHLDRLQDAIHALDVPVTIARSIHEADCVLTVKSQLKGKSKLSQLVQGKQMPLHVLKDNTYGYIVQFLKDYYQLTETQDDLEAEANREVEKVCQRVISEKVMLETSPRSEQIRRLQHDYAQSLGLNSVSVGEDPNRRVRIYPNA